MLLRPLVFISVVTAAGLFFTLLSGPAFSASRKPILRPTTKAAKPPNALTVAALPAPRAFPAPAMAPMPLALPIVPEVNNSGYTGVLIDARGLPAILRSPSPSIVGPGPDWTLIYPDRSHVPTPDEVQDESIVRYYHTEDEATRGVGGSHPLIIPAVAVIGYAKDGLQVSAADMQKLLDAEKSLHFTQTWNVGFLIPADK